MMELETGQARLRALYEITTHGELKLPDQACSASSLGQESFEGSALINPD